MNRSRSILPLVAILFVIGVSGLFRYSHDMRAVDAVGLSGSGFSLGVGFILLVLSLTGKLRPSRADERK